MHMKQRVSKIQGIFRRARPLLTTQAANRVYGYTRVLAAMLSGTTVVSQGNSETMERLQSRARHVNLILGNSVVSECIVDRVPVYLQTFLTETE